jgi:hypothetical protein
LQVFLQLMFETNEVGFFAFGLRFRPPFSLLVTTLRPPRM